MDGPWKRVCKCICFPFRIWKCLVRRVIFGMKKNRKTYESIVFICVLIVLAIFCCVFENKGSFCFSGSAHKLNWIFLLQFLKFGFISCFCFCSLFLSLSLVCMNVRASGCLLVEGWDVNAHLCGNRLLLP